MANQSNTNNLKPGLNNNQPNNLTSKPSNNAPPIRTHENTNYSANVAALGTATVAAVALEKNIE